MDLDSYIVKRLTPKSKIILLPNNMTYLHNSELMVAILEL